MKDFQINKVLFRNPILRFEHVDGFDFKPKQAIIDTIKADSTSEITFKPIKFYSTVAVILMYKSSGLQNFPNPTGEYSKHIIDCSQGFMCVVKDLYGIVSNNPLQI